MSAKAFLGREALEKGVTFANNVLRVPAGVVLSEPVKYEITSSETLTIEVGDNAGIIVEETLKPDNDARFTNEIRAGKNSILTFVSVDSTPVNAQVSRSIVLQENACVKTVLAHLESKTLSETRTTTLSGKKSDYEEQEIFFGSEKQKFWAATNVINAAPETRARVFVRGVLDDRASAECKGVMRVVHGARLASSQLDQHALLLGTEAQADNYPCLEIKENNVRQARHATTVQPLDPESVFYLRSRGIPEVGAQKLIVLGFLTPALNNVSEGAKQKILSGIKQKWRAYAVTTH